MIAISSSSNQHNLYEIKKKNLFLMTAPIINNNNNGIKLMRILNIWISCRKNNFGIMIMMMMRKYFFCLFDKYERNSKVNKIVNGNQQKQQQQWSLLLMIICLFVCFFIPKQTNKQNMTEQNRIFFQLSKFTYKQTNRQTNEQTHL